MGLAQLIRSDSEAIRRVVEERSEDQVEALREAVDWRMAAFAERIDEQLERAGDQVATRASEAAERAIADSLGQTIERMSAGVGAIDGLDSMVAEGQAATEERLREHIDDRMTAIARLIRSDNQILAESFEASAAAPAETVDPALLRQTCSAGQGAPGRAGHDVRVRVDAPVPVDVDQLHKETQSTTEAMVKVAEVLGEKIDRLSVRVDEGYGNDLQIVIDRMGDAIQAMSSVRATSSLTISPTERSPHRA